MPTAVTWPYHLDPDGLKLFCPAIGHRQFQYSREVIDALSKEGKAVDKPVAVALGNHLNVIDGPPAPVVAVHVRNRGEKVLTSRSFSAATGRAELQEVVQEPLILPLRRKEGRCVDAFDLSSTNLIID